MFRCKAEDAVKTESMGTRKPTNSNELEITNPKVENRDTSQTIDNQKCKLNNLSEDVVNANVNALSNLEINNVTLDAHDQEALVGNASGEDQEKLSPLEKAGHELCGLNWRDYYR